MINLYNYIPDTAKCYQGCKSIASGIGRLAGKVSHIAGNVGRVLTSKAAQLVTEKAAQSLTINNMGHYAVEYVGYKAGAAVPQLALGTVLANAVANQCVPSESGESPDSFRSFASRSRKWKVIFCATTVAVAGGLTWALSKFSESSDENSSRDGIVAQLVFTAVGSIFSYSGAISGGMQALKTFGYDPGEKYIQKSVQYLIAAESFHGLRQLMPTLPLGLSSVTGVVGYGLETGVGSIGWRAQSVIANVNYIANLRLGHSHHRLLVSALSLTHPRGVAGISRDLAALLTNKEISDELNRAIEPLGFFGKRVHRRIESWINKRVPANLLANTFNEFFQAIQSETVQNALNHFQNAELDEKNVARKALIRAVKKELKKNYHNFSLMPALVYGLRSKIRGQISEFIDLIPEYERDFIGISVTRLNEESYREILKVFGSEYLIYAIKRVLSSDAQADLEISDERLLYVNLTRMLLDPIDFLPNRAKNAITTGVEIVVNAIPEENSKAQQRLSFWKRLVNKVKLSVASVWGKLNYMFSCFNPRRIDENNLLPPRRSLRRARHLRPTGA